MIKYLVTLVIIDMDADVKRMILRKESLLVFELSNVNLINCPLNHYERKSKWYIFFFLIYYLTTWQRNSNQRLESNKDYIFGGILA